MTTRYTAIRVKLGLLNSVTVQAKFDDEHGGESYSLTSPVTINGVRITSCEGIQGYDKSARTEFVENLFTQAGYSWDKAHEIAVFKTDGI